MTHSVVARTTLLPPPTVETPHIVHIMMDDLGYDNLGRLNEDATSTPSLDSLLFDRGLFLTDFYTFKICGPSRASTMTGRYPFNVGFYGDGLDQHITNYTTIPELLKKKRGYKTHGIGKWDVGYVVKETTPTFKGFDTFFGYYKACNEDLFYHTTTSCNGKIGFDFSRNSGTKIQGADPNYNGTYSTRLFTKEAIERIRSYASTTTVYNHAATTTTTTTTTTTPFYLYVAPQNVHLACGTKESKAIRGIQAPCETVEGGWFDRVVNDTYKAQSAVTKELDYLVGNITRTLEETGLWNRTLIVLTSDNGGPLDHTTNWPLRGGKHTFWEGGVRVLAGISGGYLPEHRRGRQFSGLVHSADWFRTLTVGVAGVPSPDRNGTGPIPDDSFDLWPAFREENVPSPRTEVIHQVLSPYSPDQVGAIRVNEMKLIWGEKVGDARRLRWPRPGDANVTFGRTGGSRRLGDDPPACLAGTVTDGRPQTNFMDCRRGCLFNLTADPTEHINLRDQYPTLVNEMKKKLDQAAKLAPPASSYWTDPTEPLHEICLQQDNSGVLEPL